MSEAVGGVAKKPQAIADYAPPLRLAAGPDRIPQTLAVRTSPTIQSGPSPWTGTGGNHRVIQQTLMSPSTLQLQPAMLCGEGNTCQADPVVKPETAKSRGGGISLASRRARQQQRRSLPSMDQVLGRVCARSARGTVAGHGRGW